MRNLCSAFGPEAVARGSRLNSGDRSTVVDRHGAGHTSWSYILLLVYKTILIAVECFSLKLTPQETRAVVWGARN